jgi:hypothetical protein
MKRIVYIWVCIFLYFILCGKSCDDDNARTSRQVNDAANAKDSIRHQFENEVLTEEARRAAELSAIQKLQDLSDYLKIFSDVSMDSSFRNKAGEMIRGIFISEKSKLAFGQIRNEKMKDITVEKLLNDGFGDDFIRMEIHIDSIEIIEPLEISDGNDYSGKISARRSIIEYTTSDSLILPVRPVTIEFFSTHRVKLFGSDSLEVRVVSLGDICVVK